MTTSAILTTTFATDEDIVVEAGGDFVLLTPTWQRLAYGTDGAFAAGSFTMTSATANFTGNLADGNVMWLTKPADTYRGGELLIVDSVASATSVVLRRVRAANGIGVPPAGGPGALAGVEYRSLTLFPQIEEATHEISRRFGVDPARIGRTPSDLADLRDLRTACVLMVMQTQLMGQLQADQNSGWNVKYRNYSQALEDVLARLHVRWLSSADGSGSADDTASVTMRWGR